MLVPEKRFNEGYNYMCYLVKVAVHILTSAIQQEAERLDFCCNKRAIALAHIVFIPYLFK